MKIVARILVSALTIGLLFSSGCTSAADIANIATPASGTVSVSTTSAQVAEPATTKAIYTTASSTRETIIETTSAPKKTDDSTLCTVGVSCDYLLPANQSFEDLTKDTLQKMATEHGWLSMTAPVDTYDGFFHVTMTQAQKAAFTSEYEQWMIQSLYDPEQFQHISAVLPIRASGTDGAVTMFFVWTDLEPDDKGQLPEKVGGSSPGGNPFRLYSALRVRKTAYNELIGQTTEFGLYGCFNEKTGAYVGCDDLTNCFDDGTTAEVVDTHILIPDKKTLTVGGYLDESEEDAAILSTIADTTAELGWVKGALLFRSSSSAPVSTLFIRTDWDGFFAEEELGFGYGDYDVDGENNYMAAAVREALESGPFDLSKDFHICELSEKGFIKTLPFEPGMME